MSLDPFFSLSPLSPNANTYDAANTTAPYANAYLRSFGGMTNFYNPYTLTSQQANDQLLIAYDPVTDSDQTATNYVSDLYRRCTVHAVFKGTNVDTNNQYLLIFRLARAFGFPTAQFFIGTDFVRAEPLTASPHDDIAILLDVPGDNMYVHTFVRLAAPGSSHGHGFFFKGVDCYLL